MKPPTIHLRLLPLSPSSFPSSSPSFPSSSSPPSSPSSYLFQTLPVSSLSYLLPRSLLNSSKLLKIYKLTQPTQTTISLLFESSTSFKPLLQAKLTQSAPKSYFSEIQLKNTLSACLEALQMLHRADLVHGLICPDVLRQTDGNQIKLADWFCVIKRIPIEIGDLKRKKWHYLPPEALKERCLEKKFQKLGNLKLRIVKERREDGGGRSEEGGGKMEGVGKMEEGGGKREEGGGKREEGGGKREKRDNDKFGKDGDLYSLGVLFLEMSTLVSGRELVDWGKMKVKREKVEEGLERVRMRYSKGYWKVIKTLLEEDPKKRRDVWKVWEEVEEQTREVEEEGGKEEVNDEGEQNLNQNNIKNNYANYNIKQAESDNQIENGKEVKEISKEKEIEKEREREKEAIEKENEENKVNEEEEERTKEEGKEMKTCKREDNHDKRRNNVEVQKDNKDSLIFSNNLIEGNNKENTMPTQDFESPTSSLSKTLLYEKFQKKFDESISKTQILIERTKSFTTYDNSSKYKANQFHLQIKEIPAIQTPQFSSKQIIFPSITCSEATPPSSHYNPPPLSSISSSSSKPLPPSLPPSTPSLPSSNLVSSLSSHKSSTLFTPSSFFFSSLSFILPPSSSSPILRLSAKVGLTTIFYKNGQKYQGDVEGLNRHGFGLLYTPSGRIFYQGEWENDHYEGHGILNNPEWTAMEIGERGIGIRREGGKVEVEAGAIEVEWEESTEKAGGRGGWLKYEGEFKNGKADGKGILLFSNKEFLDGKFSEGKVNGLCWLSMKSGERLFGEWKNNVFIRNLC